MRTCYDQLAKDATIAVLERACRLTPAKEVAAEAMYGDLWCEPDAAKLDSLDPFGLVRKFVEAGPCLFEFFHDPPDLFELLGSMEKFAEIRRRGACGKPPEPDPWLWVICAGRPAGAMHAFGFLPAAGWPRGAYALADGWRTRLVVVNELPAVPSTLVVRIFGAGRVLRAALEELRALPQGSAVRRAVLPVVVRLRMLVAKAPQRKPDDEEFLMDTQSLVEAWERETFDRGVEKGIEKGIEKGRVEMVRAALIDVLEARGLGPSPADCARIEAESSPERLRAWHRRALTATTTADVFNE